MKSLITILLICVLCIPKITLAVWWNPTTWFSSRNLDNGSNEKIILLEQKIADLEKQMAQNLPKNDSSTITVATATSSSPITKDEYAQVAKPLKATAKPIVQKISPSTTPTLIPSVPSVPKIDYQVLYNDVFGKYLSLVERLRREILSAESLVQNSVEMKYSSFLHKMLNEANTDVTLLSSMSSVKNSDVQKFVLKYDNIIKALNDGAKNHDMASVVQFMIDNRDNMEFSKIHSEVAIKFDKYDKLAKTNYASKFRQTLTNQQSKEFIDAFLIDIGYIN